MRSKEGGFTLVELLVAMSLLALIMVAMASTLRSMAQTETRIDGKMQQLDQVRTTSNFLKDILGRVDVTSTSTQTGPAIAFQANANSISWVGVMPARYGTGGRYFFRLAIESTQTGDDLVLRYVPWSARVDFPDWGQSDKHTLVSNIQNFVVETDGLPVDIQSTPPDWPRGWHTGWLVKNAAPQRVRLTVEDALGKWQPVVVSMLPTLQSLPGSGGFVIGGAR